MSGFHYSPLLLSHSCRLSPERGGVLPLTRSAAVETALFCLTNSGVALNDSPERGGKPPPNASGGINIEVFSLISGVLPPFHCGNVSPKHLLVPLWSTVPLLGPNQIQSRCDRAPLSSCSPLRLPIVSGPFCRRLGAHSPVS